jgi:uncharacterized membrane protein
MKRGWIMTQVWRRTISGTVVVLLFLALFSAGIAGTVLASSGGDYELSWWTIDGGGGTSSGGDYSVSGTIGQPDAGSMSGGDYSLGGGFWARVSQFFYDLFLPLIMR